MNRFICFIQRTKIRTNKVSKMLLLAIICVFLLVAAGCRNKNNIEPSQPPQITSTTPTPSSDISNKNNIEPSQPPQITSTAPTPSSDIGNKNNKKYFQPKTLISSDGNYQYSINEDNSTSTLMKYVGPGGDVVSPKKIDGIPVTVIGAPAWADGGAFEGCNNITSITIPEGVTRIEDYAFKNCAKLTQVVIPASVTVIGHGAFQECPNLEAVYFEGNAPKTGNYLFDPKETPDSPDPVTIYYREGTKGWKKRWNSFSPKKY